MELDASASRDPDGDAVAYSWYVYPEAGTYAGTVEVRDAAEPRAGLRIPDDAAGRQIHVILEVADDSAIVSLKSYRRIVIDVS
ncbi:MAG: hypothetical protein ACYTAF_16385 [Planctomycetota bacterium]